MDENAYQELPVGAGNEDPGLDRPENDDAELPEDGAEQDGQESVQHHAAEQPLDRRGNVDVTVSGNVEPSSGATGQVNTYGIDHSDAAKRIREIETELKRRRRETIDPVYNQPASDFYPDTSDLLDEQSADLVMEGVVHSSVATRGRRVAKAAEARDRIRREVEDAEELAEQERGRIKLPENETMLVDPGEYKARVRALVAAEARANNQKTTVPGGRFLVDGVWVNAAGERVA